MVDLQKDIDGRLVDISNLANFAMMFVYDPITDKAISRIPKVDIEGYTEEQCLEIQKQHKELLKFSKEQNENKEVAFVLKNDVSKMVTEPIKGTDEKIDFGSALQGKD